MSRERIPAGNILALSRTSDEQSKEVEAAATSYLPTTIDLETWLPDEGNPQRDKVDTVDGGSPDGTGSNRNGRREKQTAKASAKASGDAAGRKRISLYLKDEVLTKIFRVSLEQHEQLSSATHRLILEALKARGL
jgi:hypothetical protein